MKRSPFSLPQWKKPQNFSCHQCSKPLRCCDFTPFFPNFLVGGSLKSTERVERFFLQMPMERFHPLGLFPPSKQKRVCDFFDREKGLCHNWNLRPSECSQYYCKEELSRCQSLFSYGFLKDQSSQVFENEILLAQKVLVLMGYSLKRVHRWVAEWNQWVGEGDEPRETWLLNRSERFNFYRQTWDLAQGILTSTPECEIDKTCL